MASADIESHFDTLERQQAAAKLGMWVFLASELLLFGGLFAVYGAYRARWPHAFEAGVRENTLYMGSANTLILLASSLLVALATARAREHRERATAAWSGGAILLGVGFLLIKGLEYAQHVSHGIVPGSFELAAKHETGHAAFVTLYYTMTGLHALHVLAGLSVLGWCVVQSLRRRLSPRAMEVSALYWHLVDVIWVFLWPLFYLTRGGVP